MSRIIVHIPIGDGTRDRGEDSKVLELKDKSVNILNGFFSKREIKTDTIISADAWREETAGSNAGGKALAGGLLFGVTGAVVGASMGNHYKWYGEIILPNERVFFRFDKEADTTAFIKWWEKVQKKRK